MALQSATKSESFIRKPRRNELFLYVRKHHGKTRESSDSCLPDYLAYYYTPGRGLVFWE